MPIEQTVAWTACPNGTADLGTAISEPVARLSVFVSPRLRQAASDGNTLAPFGDFLDWPETVSNIGRFVIVFDTGETVEAQPAAPSPLQSKLWKALFDEDTFVRPHAFNDYTGKLVISYPAQLVMGHIKQFYQTVGVQSFRGLPPKYVYHGETLPEELQGWLDHVGIPWDARRARALRQQLINAQQGSSAGVPTAPPDIMPTPANRQAAFEKVLLFHSPFVDPNSTDPDFKAPENPPPLPQTADDFKEALDFHQAIASLGDYPLIMRRLGLVIDLEMLQRDIPPNATRLQVVPEWTSVLGADSSDQSNWTQFLWENGRFAPASRTPNTPLIDDGLLTLNPDRYGLMQVDVDGIALKANQFAISLNHETSLSSDDTPEETGVPALRTAGLSLLENGLENQLLAHFAQTKQLNQQLEGGDPPTLFAEDLVRGYRVDVWNSLTDQWHSLCRRVGDYLFVESNTHLTGLEDEGFTQMGMTGAAEPEEGMPPVNDDVKVHESLFRWDGWSLVAARPGKVVNRSEDPDDPPETPANNPLTPFHLKTSFKPADHSLPRLRFGAGYRLRVRVADITGNSVSLETAAETFVIPQPDDPPVHYLRFEPVDAPQLVPRQPLTDSAGESLARLVIRSFNNTPAKDTQATTAAAERHVAPPRTSQLMLETHGAFDGEDGRLRDENAIYNFIANRDKPVDPNDTAEPVVSAKQMAINYLPEPLAVGAALRDLPGTPGETLGDIDALDRLLYKLLPQVDPRPGSATRIPYANTHVYPDGLLALYTFIEGEGNTVHDVSGNGAPLNLTIGDETAVTWGDGTLSVHSPTLIASGGGAFKINDAIRSSRAMTLEAWVTPQIVDQDGPARIVTCSLNPTNRNFALGHGRWGDQPKDVFDARLRTTQTNANGEPSLTTPPGTLLPQMMHVVYTRDHDGHAAVYVDGEEQAAGTVGGNLSNWNRTYKLALANELTANRPWLGTYHLVAIYNRALSADEVAAHCAHGPELPLTRIPLLDWLMQLRPFRLILSEGADAPDWDAAARELKLTLPKAEVWTGPLSSYMLAEDLKLMGVWQWLREYVNSLTADANRTVDELEQIAVDLVEMAQVAIEGGHWMLTPARRLSLVHVVQQPLGHPDFHELAANRQAGATGTHFAGTLLIHGKSTAKIDLMARWQEPVDPLDEPGPRWEEKEAHVEEIPLKSLNGGPIIVPANPSPGPNDFVTNTTLGDYDPDDDAIHFVAVLGGFPRSPLHVFGDTRRRLVQYKAIATSRFREYFVAEEVTGGFARESVEVLVDVPSSERPLPPRLVYVIPAYGWQRQTTTNMIASKRQGGTLRIYMERPWYSSGQGELLGVVLSRDLSLTNQEREEQKAFITQWGQDPIWGSNQGGFPHPRGSLPTSSAFTNKVATGNNLLLPELGANVNVAAHNVAYDADRQLWYCDVEVNPGEAYMPFIRLALARYQPSSVDGKHLSPVVVADFAQLAPDRAAILTFDPYQTGTLNLTVSGFTYTSTALPNMSVQPDRSQVVVKVEMRHPEIGGDLGWTAAGDTAVIVQTEGTAGNILWRGVVTLPADREPGHFRLVIREYERLPGQAQRLVYADILPL